MDGVIFVVIGCAFLVYSTVENACSFQWCVPGTGAVHSVGGT
jgi:hypothetical protein